MIFPSDVVLSLNPQPKLPNMSALFLRILNGWRACGLAAGECRRIVEDVLREKPSLEELLDPAAPERGEALATRRLQLDLFQEPTSTWDWSFRSNAAAFAVEDVLSTGDAATMADLLRIAKSSATVDAFKANAADIAEQDLLELLARPVQVDRFGVWPQLHGAGLFRREHASLFICSNSTRLVTDPQGRQRSWASNGGRYPLDPSSLDADGVLITHSHEDHWHLPSILLTAASANTTVFVPSVPKRSILTYCDMADTLALVGQSVATPSWGTTIAIGDIEVETLPFLGEQPTIDFPLDPALRNWGNCYRFDTPGFSAMILVDAGQDPAGDVVDAVADSVSRRGPLDVLLSYCFAFPAGLNAGLPHYFSVIPFTELRRLQDRRNAGHPVSMTLGPRGVARACQAARARYFLPYAQGFMGLGNDPASPEGGRLLESEVLKSIGEELASLGASTEVVSWRPGDVARFDGPSLRIER